MELDQLLSLVYFGVGASLCFIVLYKFTKYSFGINSLLLLPILYYLSLEIPWVPLIMYLGCPLLLINTVLFVYLDSSETAQKIDPRYTVTFKTNRGKLQLHNIKRGASIIGAAGSGKTESVVYGF
ncbi:MAG TPA: mobilization protein, partial [Leeuwenhoekiella sp.]|nr:mobilization protein [Leeuwenhoekiella sp.]